MSLTAGYCQLGNLFGGTSAGSSQLPSLGDQLGVKVEQRLRSNLGLSLSVDPPSDALLCSGGARTFTFTPRQFGLDLFRTWRF